MTTSSRDDEVTRILKAFASLDKHIERRHGPYKRGTSQTVEGWCKCPLCGSYQSVQYRRSKRGRVYGKCHSDECTFQAQAQLQR